MDILRDLEERLDPDYGDAAVMPERPPVIGTDERRMHVRAYNHWVSLLKGKPYPAIEHLDPENISDFGPHSVLLQFTDGLEDPEIRYLGPKLREECGVDAAIRYVGQVPSRSLLSRLTDHYLQIIANRAPIGFEAEFVSQRGHNTMYRGILMPFSSDGETIDFIYGVINWKELVDAETQALLAAEVETARRALPPRPAVSAWADGPGAAMSLAEPELVPSGVLSVLPDDSGLADRLMRARETAAAARAADTRSRAALYRALSRAYDFALAAESVPASYARLIEDAGIAVQARAPMTPAVKLVFGVDYDKTRLTEFAAVLAYARRQEVAPGGLDALLESSQGGIKAIVRAERARRQPSAGQGRASRAVAALRTRPPLAQVQLDAGEGEFVVLLARAAGNGAFDIIGSVADDSTLIDRVIRRTV